jgi:hypothetical protein
MVGLPLYRLLWVESLIADLCCSSLGTRRLSLLMNQTEVEQLQIKAEPELLLLLT